MSSSPQPPDMPIGGSPRDAIGGAHFQRVSSGRFVAIVATATVVSFVAAVIADGLNSGDAAPLLNRLVGSAVFGFVVAYGLREGGSFTRPGEVAGIAGGAAVLFVPNLASMPVASLLSVGAPSVLEAIVNDPSLFFLWGVTMLGIAGGLVGGIAYWFVTRPAPGARTDP